MQEIKHPGIILQETETHFEVLLTEAVSCSGCALQGSCGSSQGKPNTFLLAKENATFKEGDAVQITLQQHLGLKAVLWAYVLPFFILMSVLVLLSSYVPDWLIGLIVIGALALYFYGIHRFNAHLEKIFKIRIQPV